jgi:carotenoid cleavage dioxygenase
MAATPAPGDALDTEPLGWTSDDPHLSGAFAPVGPELDAADLPVVAGRIPPDLRGAYMRNGANPRFKPITYTYPFDGDGMIHAVHFEDGRARYRNRYVRTGGLAVERRAGRAVYGGLMRPIPVDPALVGPDGDPGPFKDGAFINILRHGPHLLALSESQPAYAMTPELDTIGPWHAGTDRPLELGAHNRRHPVTGDLFAIRYSAEQPRVTVHHIDPGGTLARSFDVALAAPTMIHDFVLTDRHLVFVIGPVVFDLPAMAQGGSPLQWKPELGTRIGVLPLDGGAVRWIEAPPCFVFHFANGFERGGEIVVDYVRHAGFGGAPGGARQPPLLHRMVLDPRAGTLRDDPLGAFGTEFPRVDDRLNALPSRIVYTPTRTGSIGQAPPPTGAFNALMRVDAETGALQCFDGGAQVLGEPVFIPRPGATAEAAGYLVTFAYDPARDGSDLLLLDAEHVEAGPVAVIPLPQRVPQGLHGNWMPA